MNEIEPPDARASHGKIFTPSVARDGRPSPAEDRIRASPNDPLWEAKHARKVA
jgi:hypothetical protein